RNRAEYIFRHPPRSTPPEIIIEILRLGPISNQFKGMEIAWQVQVAGSCGTCYVLHRVLGLDESNGVFARVVIQGAGLFRDAEASWRHVLDSFSWNPAEAVVLKFDGDEAVHRARYKKIVKPVRESARSPNSRLARQVNYLQPVIDELLALP